MLRSESLFDLSDYQHPQLIRPQTYGWEGLNLLKEYMGDYPYQLLYTPLLQENMPLQQTLILHNGDIITGEEISIEFGSVTKGELKVYHANELLAGASVLMAGVCFSGKQIDIGKGVVIEPGVMIKGPAVIGDCCEVRQGAYLRGHVLAGRRCVLGHTTEIKHSIFLNDAKAGHFNYIGDSILGHKTNLGAGTKLANLRFIKGNLHIRYDDELIDTGRRKFGALLGDNTQTGCNSVTNPGTIIGKDSFVMPNTTVRSGLHPANSSIR